MPRIVVQTCRDMGNVDEVPFFAEHPYSRSWRCRSGRPVLIRIFRLDRRGFFQQAWARLVVRQGRIIAPQQAPDIIR